ncbi:MAG: PilZ domain-containing protein [Spirochaetota bacterium]
MRNTPDKRFFDRLKTNSFSIDYKIINGGSVYHADVINISAGGMCFLRTSILEKGDMLQIKLPFHSKKIILTGEIIRIEGREVAVKFLDDEHQIEKFVESFNVEFLGVRAKSKMITKHPVDDSNLKTESDNNNFFDDIDKI